MKPKLRKAVLNPACSFVVRKDTGKNMQNCWQYHPEYEIIYIKKSSGFCMIGDYMGNFQNGDILILGPDIPHFLQHDQRYIETNDERAGVAIVILFRKEILEQALFAFPEAKEIFDLLSLAKRGLKIRAKSRKDILLTMEEMLCCNPGRRMVDFFEVLQTLSEIHQYELLVSNGYSYISNGIDDNRINKVIEYTLNHFDNDISIENVAALINMTKYSFCRFFKEITRKTYIEFLVEVRIGKACRLLIEENMHISEVCYSCGYNSISHFNHQFKEIKGISPLEFKNKYFRNLALDIVKKS